MNFERRKSLKYDEYCNTVKAQMNRKSEVSHYEPKIDLRKNKSVEFEDDLLHCYECNAEYIGECAVHKSQWILNKKINCSYTRLRSDHIFDEYYNENLDTTECFCKTNCIKHIKTTLPTGFFLVKSQIENTTYGVWTKNCINRGTILGPFLGHLTCERIITGSGNDSVEDGTKDFIWSLIATSNVGNYNLVDGRDCMAANYLRFIRCSNNRDDNNLIPIQFDGKIFYQAFKNISSNEELMVSYVVRSFHPKNYHEFIAIRIIPPRALRSINDPQLNVDKKATCVLSTNSSGLPSISVDNSFEVTSHTNDSDTKILRSDTPEKMKIENEIRNFSDTPNKGKMDDEIRSISDTPNKRKMDNEIRNFSDTPNKGKMDDEIRSISDTPNKRKMDDEIRSISDTPNKRKMDDEIRSISDTPNKRKMDDEIRNFSDTPNKGKIDNEIRIFLSEILKKYPTIETSEVNKKLREMMPQKPILSDQTVLSIILKNNMRPIFGIDDILDEERVYRLVQMFKENPALSCQEAKVTLERMFPDKSPVTFETIDRIIRINNLRGVCVQRRKISNDMCIFMRNLLKNDPWMRIKDLNSSLQNEFPNEPTITVEYLNQVVSKKKLRPIKNARKKMDDEMRKFIYESYYGKNLTCSDIFQKLSETFPNKPYVSCRFIGRVIASFNLSDN